MDVDYWILFMSAFLAFRSFALA